MTHDKPLKHPSQSLIRDTALPWKLATDNQNDTHSRVSFTSTRDLLKSCGTLKEPGLCQGLVKLSLAKHDNIQGGPLPVISGVVTPISRVITPVIHL